MSILDASKPPMNHRERFRRLMHFQTVDRGVHWEFGYLQQTVDRWHQEGLPADISPALTTAARKMSRSRTTNITFAKNSPCWAGGTMRSAKSGRSAT